MQESAIIPAALKTLAMSLREVAKVAEALAQTTAAGTGSDTLLRTHDIALLLRCGDTKAREIMRAHGTGCGKMARIEKGKLMMLHENGLL